MMRFGPLGGVSPPPTLAGLGSNSYHARPRSRVNRTTKADASIAVVVNELVAGSLSGDRSRMGHVKRAVALAFTL